MSDLALSDVLVDLISYKVAELCLFIINSRWRRLRVEFDRPDVDMYVNCGVDYATSGA